MRRFALLGAIAAVLAAAPAASAGTPLPRSIAAIGDSITQAADVCCWYGEYPWESWSTGDGVGDGIASHYERILALRPSIQGRSYNDARTGAKMRDAEAQAQAAVAQRARYVTFLLGANDVCTSSFSTMTPVAAFRDQFAAALSTLASDLPPRSHIFVSSIPNAYTLWQVLHSNPITQFVWSIAQICQSMLSPANTEADRRAVLAREVAFNRVLADVCGQYPLCRFDDYAVFSYPFSASQISTLDYFHPSLAGQAALASLTWQHSWWPTL